MMKVVYGYDAKSNDDRLVRLSIDGGALTIAEGVAGFILIDFLPFRTSLRGINLADLTCYLLDKFPLP